jgi:hypothetical protein
MCTTDPSPLASNTVVFAPSQSNMTPTTPLLLFAHVMSHTHFADIFRYILDGVKNSAGIEEKTGTRFGGLGDLTAAANTSRMVSSDG